MYPILKLLDYDRATGTFRWKETRSRGALKGAIAGGLYTHGYINIRSLGKNHLAHRLVWFVEKGLPLPAEVDHINGNRADNRIENLRAATRQENMRNIRKVRGVGALKGTSWSQEGKKWRADIRIGGKKKYLGLYNTELEAHAAYCNFAQEHFGEFANFGDNSPFSKDQE